MTENKHTVSTDALGTLGTIIDETAGRDAIHLAVEPVIAGERLAPGQHVLIKDGVAVAGAAYADAFGIVDPFLPRDVMPGERFWFVVYPRQITSLRHVWEHPMFPDKPAERALTPEEAKDVDRIRLRLDKAASEQWLADFCANGSGPSYDSLMEALARADFTEEYLHINDDAYGNIPDEFWDHVEAVIGRRLGPDERPEHFSCAC